MSRELRDSGLMLAAPKAVERLARYIGVTTEGKNAARIIAEVLAYCNEDPPPNGNRDPK